MIDSMKHSVLGVNVHAVDYESSVQQIIESASTGKTFGVSALAVHGVMTGVMDPEHRYRLNQLELVVPDGQPVRWALNWLHQAALKDRVYGPELMLRTCASAAEHGLPIYLFGGTEDLLELLAQRLVSRFPALKIAGTRASLFRTIDENEKTEIIEDIRNSGAAITFVGLGCPRQEVWTFEFKDHLRMPVLAVGAAYNFHAGILAQAPTWMQQSGLEWMFRLIKEPRRLWRRYVYLNPYYLALVLCQKTGLKRFDPEDTRCPAREILYG